MLNALPNMPKNYCQEFALNGTRVNMMNHPMLQYTKGAVPLRAAPLCAPLTIQKILPKPPPVLSVKHTSQYHSMPASGNVINGINVENTLRTTEYATQLIKQQLQRTETLNSYPHYLEQSIRRLSLSIRADAHSAKTRISTGNSQTSKKSANKLLRNIAQRDLNISPEVTLSTALSQIHVLSPSYMKQENRNSNNYTDNNMGNISCSNSDVAESHPEFSNGENKDISTISLKDTWAFVPEGDNRTPDYGDAIDDDTGSSNDASSTQSAKLHGAKHKRRKSRWKSGRKPRLKPSRSKKSLNKPNSSPSSAPHVPPLPITQVSPQFFNAKSQALKTLKGVHAAPHLAVGRSAHRNQTEFSDGNFSLQKCLVSNDVSQPAAVVQNGGWNAHRSSLQLSRRSVDMMEPERVTKVYLSQAQAKLLYEMGMSMPSAPPATPRPEQLRNHEYIPCLYDIMAQRSLKAQLEVMEQRELRKKEKVLEEKLKLEKQESKAKEKLLRQHQRKEIYALNKVMTEMENNNFHNFINTYGLNTQDQRQKNT